MPCPRSHLLGIMVIGVKFAGMHSLDDAASFFGPTMQAEPSRRFWECKAEEGQLGSNWAGEGHIKRIQRQKKKRWYQAKNKGKPPSELGIVVEEPVRSCQISYAKGKAEWTDPTPTW